MSYSEFKNSSFSQTWFLVEYINTDGKKYDIINRTHIIFKDKKSDLRNLHIGQRITVQCTNETNSIYEKQAYIKQISDNTDWLAEQLNRKNKITKIKILESNKKVILEPNKDINKLTKTKKRKRSDENVIDENFGNKNSHKIALLDNKIAITKMDNQKLEAELKHKNKIIKELYKKITDTANKIKQKFQDIQTEDNDNLIQFSATNKSYSPVLEKDNMMLIGTGMTPIPRNVYNQINWTSFTAATRKLLMAVFSRETLATHTLTGKPSPAFLGQKMPTKTKLDSAKVADIIEIVSNKCGVTESLVRNAITIKCADENKMFKKRNQKRN